MAVARPDEVVVAGAPVGAAITSAVEIVRAASTIAVDLHLTVQSEVTTRCSATELAHLIYGLTLDAVTTADDEPTNPPDPPNPPNPPDPPNPPNPPDPPNAPNPIELFVRQRTIDGKPWLEIVRGARAVLDGEHFDLRAVEAIAIKNGGELGRSERRGGGTELVVALPMVVSTQLATPP
jgi:hypothetical protein